MVSQNLNNPLCWNRNDDASLHFDVSRRFYLLLLLIRLITHWLTRSLTCNHTLGFHSWLWPPPLASAHGLSLLACSSRVMLTALEPLTQCSAPSRFLWLLFCFCRHWRGFQEFQFGKRSCCESESWWWRPKEEFAVRF